ncbi:18079_t:CDS:2, partial [Acaulospora morrowiae]
RQINLRPTVGHDKYSEKYKGISICFNILTKSFSGRYVNFGVFELYGDKALEVALNASFEMMLNVELEDILSAKLKTKLHWLLTYLTQFPRVLPYLLTANFNAVLFEDRQTQWSLSRPLLCLILLNQDYFNEYIENLLRHQLPERREILQKAIKTLMTDVDYNLNSKNRDRFTQNLGTFKRELTNDNVILISPPMDLKLM